MYATWTYTAKDTYSIVAYPVVCGSVHLSCVLIYLCIYIYIYISVSVACSHLRRLRKQLSYRGGGACVRFCALVCACLCGFLLPVIIFAGNGLIEVVVLACVSVR